VGSGCVVPALISWAVVVVPAGIDADGAGGDLRAAYFPAASKALALGPLIGFAQATALRPFTRRWGWWIPANIVSWLIVDAIFFVVSLIGGGFDFAHGRGSPVEAFVVLIATTPVSARWMLWVTAPGATIGNASGRRRSGTLSAGA
jgi:hypothetical protein